VDIEVKAEKHEVERMARESFTRIHTNFHYIEILMRTWTNSDVAKDIFNIRKDVAELEKKCYKLLEVMNDE